VDVFGGHLEATAGKEVTSFVASATRDALPELTAAIAETLTAPKLDSWELSEASYWATAKLEALKNASGAALSADVAAAVFGEASGLGHHALPSATRWGKLTTGDVKDFLSAHVQGNNMVLAGVNVDHATLVEQADLLLMGIPEGAPSKFAAVSLRGGEFITRSESTDAAMGFGLGLAGINAKTQAAVAVLTAALGSVRGPRPFTSVRKNLLATLAEKVSTGDTKLPTSSTLNASAAHFSDATLLSFTGATSGTASGEWLALAIATLKDIAAGKLTEEEVARAKSVATLQAVGPLGGISGLRNDMGAQLVLTGKHSDAAAQVATFAAVSKADVEKAAATLLKSGVPGVAVHGNAASVPRFDALAASLL
jgi:predicted Zn-dependent peptidase